MKKPKIIAMEFRPAEGGMVSETHTETPRGGQGGGPMMDHDSETAVHGSMEHAVAHMKKHMGHCFKGGGEAEAEPK